MLGRLSWPWGNWWSVCGGQRGPQQNATSIGMVSQLTRGTKRLKASQPLSSILVVLNKRHVHPNQSKGLLGSGFSGTRSGTTPDPYPRSITPFHTCLKGPFHTSVPYLWSIRYDTWVHTCKNMFTTPKPCDCVGKSVPAALTAATYFVVWW